MIIRSFLVLTIFTQLGSTANTQRSERHEPTISECAAKVGECDESKGRPVCGTDDQTYPTRCHLMRVQCSGHQVSLKYRGPCRACKEAREYALKHKSRNPTKFIPRCKSDGTYAPIQCLGDSGCWCSDLYGKPIENTSVRTGKPKCREYNRANVRRSPSRMVVRERVRRACSRVDRAAFNGNLIKVFQSEYIRAGQQQRDLAGGIRTAASGFVPPADKLVLDWKFRLLDGNSNDLLDKIEFRELKKLVKRAVKPRRCGRAFGKFCDVDHDDRLSRSEWNNCLSKDGHTRLDHNKFKAVNNATHGYINYNSKTNTNSNSYNNNNSNNNSNNNHHQYHLNTNINTATTSATNNNHHHNTILNNHNNNNSNRNKMNTFHNFALEDPIDDSNAEDDDSVQHYDYDDPDYEVDDDEDDNNVNLHTSGLSTNYPFTLRESSHKESEVESDCFADQKQALEEQRTGGTTPYYVPDCTPDGRYQRVQCYHQTPYCWCVHEDTGKNIEGTSVKNKRPQCDTIYTVVREMKGCPEPKKSAFLKDLKNFLNIQMLANTNNGVNSTIWKSEDERIATSSFVLLDKNKNKVWERKEWKTFRELVMASKTLRKCGKKMPRYCDVNSDKKITLSEWLACLQTQNLEIKPQPQQQTLQQATQSNESATSKSTIKLTGSNPLEQYLKD